MYIAGAKFDEHWFNISRVILYWMLCFFSGTTYDITTYLICIIQKREDLQNENRYAKKENANFFFTLKSLLNRQQLINIYLIGTLDMNKTT